jgi:hypothetical protein
MKTLIISFLVLWIAILTSCDMRSGIAKKEMEKYELAPTPTIAPQPTGTPIDPADIVQVDVYQEGDTISIDGLKQNKTAACTKYNRVTVNGDDSIVTVKGACRQMMINGDRNKVTADAAMEFVFNGSENVVKYSRFPNGKQPSVIDNRGGNVVEKIPAQGTTDQQRQKSVK